MEWWLLIGVSTAAYAALCAHVLRTSTKHDAPGYLVVLFPFFAQYSVGSQTITDFCWFWNRGWQLLFLGVAIITICGPIRLSISLWFWMVTGTSLWSEILEDEKS